MLVYMYPNGKYIKYKDGKRNWTHVEASDPDLAALDEWGREEARIEWCRRRKKYHEYNSKAARIAREVQARARELQQKEERATAEYMKESERRFWENYGDLLDFQDDLDISLNRVINRGDDDR
jgi:hypothetical protein